MQALEARQCLEVSINAFLISYALDPWHEVIIKYALMKLVKSIRGDASEYVRVGKISQEWVITGTESIILKEVRKFPITVSLKCTKSPYSRPQSTVWGSQQCMQQGWEKYSRYSHQSK